MEKITKAEYKKMTEIYENAVNLYLDKSDFNAMDWMDDEDLKEYTRLYKKDMSECPQCGEINCKH